MGNIPNTSFVCKMCAITFATPRELILHKKENHMEDLRRICFKEEVHDGQVKPYSFDEMPVADSNRSLCKNEIEEKTNDAPSDPLTVWVSPVLKLETAYLETEENETIELNEATHTNDNDTINVPPPSFAYESESEMEMKSDSEEMDPLEISYNGENFTDGSRWMSMNQEEHDEGDDDSNSNSIYSQSPRYLNTSGGSTKMTSSSPFQCRYCKVVLRKRSYLVEHERIHTGEKPFVCNTCNTAFRWKATWKRHCRKGKCSAKTTNSIIKHTKQTTLNSYYSRISKNEGSIDKSVGQQPNLISNQNQPERQSVLIRVNHPHVHRKIVNGSVVNTCKFCKKSFRSYCSIKAHIRTHTGEKPYSCSICGMRFAARANMCVHKRRHFGKKLKICSGCDGEFADSSSLYHHKKSGICVNNSDLDNNSNSFSSSHEVPVSISRPISVARRSSVSLSVSSSSSSFQAVEYRDQFFPSNNRNQGQVKINHHAVHKIKSVYPNIIREIGASGVVVNICKFCHREFDALDKIKLHLRTHTGEKPYSCSFCQQRFSQTGTMRIHERLHTGERPCLCSQCGEGFISYGAVNYHKNSGKCPMSNGSARKDYKNSGVDVEATKKSGNPRQRQIQRPRQRQRKKGVAIRTPKAEHPHVTRKLVDGVICNFCNFCEKPFRRYYDATRHTLIHLKQLKQMEQVL